MLQRLRVIRSFKNTDTAKVWNAKMSDPFDPSYNVPHKRSSASSTQPQN